MSASSSTEWTIRCDYRGGCRQRVTGTTRETASDIRRELRGRGWVSSNPLTPGRRLDYCPGHKPGGRR